MNDARCENCYYSRFDQLWGEYGCKKHGRTCTPSELAMGCNDYLKNTSKPDDPPPEIVVRSGATYTPIVTENGVLSWTNDKGLPNPNPVNLKPKDGYTPVKGVDYYTEQEKQAFSDAVIETLKNTVMTAKIREVTLLADAWIGEGNLHSQVVSIEGVTENSQVDLTPDVQQLAIFHNKDLAFVTENDGGVVTVYAIGQKPANDYIIQVTITEVDV